MFSVKSMMRSTVAVGGALVLLASGASAANALTFTPTGAVAWKASATNPITLKIGAGAGPTQNRTCLPGATAGTGSVANIGGQAYITGLNFPAGSLTCTDGTGATYQTTINLSGNALINSSFFAAAPHLDITDAGPVGTGLVAQPSGYMFAAQYVNGTTGINGANPSTATVLTSMAVGRVIDTKYNPGTIVGISLSGTFKLGTTTAAVTVS
jgi:hypothetical protein